MRQKSSSVSVYLAIVSITLVIGCQHVEDDPHDIVIRDFSDKNYFNLDRSLGTSICVHGKITIDEFHGGVYFPLQTNKNSDVITVDLSRINSGLTYDYARRNAMVHGENYRVCGTLRDATPFRKCEDNYCKWYRLENPKLR